MESVMRIVHQNQRFPLKISEKLEKKIRVLCDKFPKTEWSGQLFYTFTGSFEKGDIAFVAEDLLFMDTGCGTATEFYLDECNAAAYMADHELWHCQMGLIHSHNMMAAFFSGQDDSMLLQEGNSRNHFLSLVVNNEGKYVARVTAKEVTEFTIKTTKKYKTFGDKSVEQFVGEEVKTSESVVTYDLDITNDFKFTCDDYDELMETIKQCDEIKKSRIERERKENEAKNFGGKKKKGKGKKDKPSFPGKPQIAISSPYQPDKDSQEFNSQRPHWSDEIPFEEGDELFTGEYIHNEVPRKVLKDEEVAYYAAQILSLGFLHTNTQGIANFVANMDKLMSGRFKDMKSYSNALSMFCDYLLDSELLDKLDREYSPDQCDDAYMNAKIQIAEFFSELLKADTENVYLQEIYDYINN